jgi:hypothetical protein
MKNIFQGSSKIGSLKAPTTIYENNDACIIHMQTNYIKSNITKHIAPKLFYSHELQKEEDFFFFANKVVR